MQVPIRAEVPLQLNWVHKSVLLLLGLQCPLLLHPIDLPEVIDARVQRISSIVPQWWPLENGRASCPEQNQQCSSEKDALHGLLVEQYNWDKDICAKTKSKDKLKQGGMRMGH